MNHALKDQMLQLWRETVAQCRKTVDFSRETGFRICLNGIDITDAELAITETRIEHLEKLITALQAEDT